MLWGIFVLYQSLTNLAIMEFITGVLHQCSTEGQVFGGNHSEIGTNDQKRPIWPRNDRNNFLRIVEISEAVMVLDTS
jgi:hypothetical protein